MTCEACKTIPPVVAEGYEPKGTYEEIAGLKTYVVGDQSAATKAIVDVYDIFGLANQTLQGADALAAALGAVVLVPDFLEGEYAKPEFFGQLTPEKQAIKDAFMARVSAFSNFTDKLSAVVQAGKTKFPSVTSWGSVGLCWGGKVIVLLSGPGAIFKASAQVHPGMLAAEDAEKLTIPHMVLASNGEDAEVVKQYKAIIEGEGKIGEVETYATMHHGWMGARANLSNADNLKEYERGYNQLSGFFAKYL